MRDVFFSISLMNYSQYHSVRAHLCMFARKARIHLFMHACN